MDSHFQVASEINDAEIEHLLSDLIMIPSVNPRYASGREPDETEIAEYVAGKLSDFGFEVKKQRVEDERCNVIARVRGNEQETLTLNGHLDTVTGANMHDPFSPRISDGRLYGRGSSDMKGGIAAMIEAAKTILASGVKLRGNLVLSFVVDEEHMGMGAQRFLEEERPDFAIIGEPTQNRIGLAQAGYIELDIKSEGDIKHGSTLRIGDNTSAYINAVRILNRVLELPSIRQTRRHLDIEMYNTINFCPKGQRTFSSCEWMTVDYCETGILIGVTPSYSVVDSDKVIEGIIRELEDLVRDSNNAGQRNKLCQRKMHGFIQPRNEFIKRFEKAMDKTQGAHKHTYVSSFCDGTFFFDKGISTLHYGPGSMALAHSSNEYVDLNEVKQATRTYAEAIVSILGIEDGSP